MEIPFEVAQFFNENDDPNGLTKWWQEQDIPIATRNQTGKKDRVARFAAARGYVGTFWGTELVVLSPHIGNGFLITAAVKL